AGYSQIDIAELINIEQNTYSDLETGKRKIDLERILQLANIYGVSVDSILNPPPPIKVMVIKKQYFLQPL
ncbi:MAG: Helix-turn-helix domain, partial [Bacteroidota bacterium]